MADDTGASHASPRRRRCDLGPAPHSEHGNALVADITVRALIAGPAKLHPGIATIPDRFEYVLVEPAA
ncbi:MAG TPA: hypothetical protein VKA01_01130 [Vicinamibacteria bacterium]|nr:hypothetical protein [Vicinamibacteria bacterium]